MRPHGTVYQSNSTPSGSFRVALTEKEKKRFKAMRFLGTNLSSFALAFMLFFYGPGFEMDLNYQAGLAKASNQSLVTSKQNDFQITNYQLPVANEFVISIPAIGATAKVVSGVNPYDETVYTEALKKGIAHAAGTALPGEGGRVYLFAHSTNSPVNFSEYNAIFYQLRLLSQGDRIFVNFDGVAHLYRVTEKIVVDANDTHWLTGKSVGEELVLQTCDPPGTTLRRLLIIARRG